MRQHLKPSIKRMQFSFSMVQPFHLPWPGGDLYKRVKSGESVNRGEILVREGRGMKATEGKGWKVAPSLKAPVLKTQPCYPCMPLNSRTPIFPWRFLNRLLGTLSTQNICTPVREGFHAVWVRGLTAGPRCGSRILVWFPAPFCWQFDPVAEDPKCSPLWSTGYFDERKDSWARDQETPHPKVRKPQDDDFYPS